MPKKEEKNIEKLAGMESKRFMFLRRLLAFLIDFFIISTIVNLAFRSLIKERVNLEGLGLLDGYQTLIANYESLSPILIAMAITGACLSLLYFTFMELKLNQTLGKMLTRIYVKSQTNELTVRQCIIRNVPKSLFFISELQFMLIVDVIYMAFRKQRLFEKWSKTKVE